MPLLCKGLDQYLREGLCHSVVGLLLSRDSLFGAKRSHSLIHVQNVGVVWSAVMAKTGLRAPQLLFLTDAIRIVD